MAAAAAVAEEEDQWEEEEQEEEEEEDVVAVRISSATAVAWDEEGDAHVLDIAQLSRGHAVLRTTAGSLGKGGAPLGMSRLVVCNTPVPLRFFAADSFFGALGRTLVELCLARCDLGAWIWEALAPACAVLAALSLDGNDRVGPIPRMVLRLCRLRRLSVRQCGLEVLPVFLFECMDLSDLLADGNALGRLPAPAYLFARTHRLSVSGNPWIERYALPTSAPVPSLLELCATAVHPHLAHDALSSLPRYLREYLTHESKRCRHCAHVFFGESVDLLDFAPIGKCARVPFVSAMCSLHCARLSCTRGWSTRLLVDYPPVCGGPPSGDFLQFLV